MVLLLSWMRTGTRRSCDGACEGGGRSDLSVPPSPSSCCSRLLNGKWSQCFRRSLCCWFCPYDSYRPQYYRPAQPPTPYGYYHPNPDIPSTPLPAVIPHTPPADNSDFPTASSSLPVVSPSPPASPPYSAPEGFPSAPTYLSNPSYLSCRDILMLCLPVACAVFGYSGFFYYLIGIPFYSNVLGHGTHTHTGPLERFYSHIELPLVLLSLMEALTATSVCRLLYQVERTVIQDRIRYIRRYIDYCSTWPVSNFVSAGSPLEAATSSSHPAYSSSAASRSADEQIPDSPRLTGSLLMPSSCGPPDQYHRRPLLLLPPPPPPPPAPFRLSEISPHWMCVQRWSATFSSVVSLFLVICFATEAPDNFLCVGALLVDCHEHILWASLSCLWSMLWLSLLLRLNKLERFLMSYQVFYGGRARSRRNLETGEGPDNGNNRPLDNDDSPPGKRANKLFPKKMGDARDVTIISAPHLSVPGAPTTFPWTVSGGPPALNSIGLETSGLSQSTPQVASLPLPVTAGRPSDGVTAASAAAVLNGNSRGGKEGRWRQSSTAPQQQEEGVVALGVPLCNVVVGEDRRNVEVELSGTGSRNEQGSSREEHLCPGNHLVSAEELQAGRLGQPSGSPSSAGRHLQGPLHSLESLMGETSYVPRNNDRTRRRADDCNDEDQPQQTTAGEQTK